ncbi:MAG TPA: acyl-CoA dehydrogenase family protein [Actinopolymorphaceae bacterium]|nr:acyl-CoA dehydrogenase family protein [Actinopolymorphaceae bacterium]
MRVGYYGDDHGAFRSSFRTFCERDVVPRQPDWDKAGMVDHDVWRIAGRQGFLVPAADQAYGGLGISDLRYEQIMMEELARVHESGFGIALHNAIVAPYLMQAGTRQQKRRYLTMAVTGDMILAIAITEPEAGSDAAAMRTKATDAGDHWVLDGAKTFVSNGICADLVVVAARTQPDRRHGIGLFLVETGTPGFTRGRKLDKLGLRTQDTAELFFDNCRIPKENVLGNPAEGFSEIMRLFAQERLVVAMSSVAGAEVALQDTLAYVRDRQAFGRPLAAFQDTRFRLAQMRTEIDVAQAHVDRCVLAAGEGALDPASAASAKLFSTEMLGRVVDDCVQMHGGYGYMWEYPICRAYADARVQRIYAGTSEIMKDIISRSMLGDLG